MLIERRFCGPPESANGGYFAGLAASASGLTGPVEVTLRLPPPLQTPMDVVPTGQGASVMLGDQRVADAVTGDIDLDIPPPVTQREAEAASADPIWTARDHPFPGCFVCGPGRPVGDGLRLFPGPVTGGGAAAVWQPADSLPHDDGAVRSEIVWAALDCPSFFGAIATGQAKATTALLGRLCAEVLELPRVGQPFVVQGWGVAASGRKISAGSVVRTVEGDVLARASAIWITVG